MQGHDTTHFIRQAMAGDHGGMTAVIERFEPFLHAAASYHLGPQLRGVCEPRDLTMEVWAVALRRFGDLRFESGVSSRAFMSFLVSTMRNLVNNLLRRHLKAGRLKVGTLEAGDSSRPDPFDLLPAEVTGATSRARLDELRSTFAEALERLSPDDRAIIVLRAIEQVPYEEAALVLGVAKGTLAVRYHRALEKLRSLLPDSLIHEFAADDGDDPRT